MTLAKTVLAAGTRFSGQLVAEGDVQIEGRFEGGPLKVGGRLTVSAQGHVEATQAEVVEAEVLGLFRGTLKARDVVRLHSTGRVLGDIFSPRVVFVSDSEAAASAAPSPAVSPPSAPARKPSDSAPPLAAPSPVLSPAAPASPVLPPPPVRAPRRTPPSATPAAPTPPVGVAPVPVAPTQSPAAPAPSVAPSVAPPSPRTIPALPSLGQRSMQRLPSREP
ncbi:MAG: polymer-forming cytoskeletal protein [Myxococcales bacterium]|nr:polymer-forming cytoskeletal protein [Myxococcales bacterium]